MSVLLSPWWGSRQWAKMNKHRSSEAPSLRYQDQVFPGMNLLFHSAQASERPVCLIKRLRSICSLRSRRIVSRDFFTPPTLFRSRGTVSHLSSYAILLCRYGSCSFLGRFCHLSLLANSLIWHKGIAHCYSSKIARSRRLCFQPTQWKRYGSWPTTFSNVAALHTGGKEIQLRVRVTPSCLGGIGALKNTHVSMRWQLFSLLFLDIHGAIPAPTGHDVKKVGQGVHIVLGRKPLRFLNTIVKIETGLLGKWREGVL